MIADVILSPRYIEIYKRCARLEYTPRAETREEREKKTLIIWFEINNIARGEQFRESFRKYTPAFSRNHIRNVGAAL